MDSGIPVEEFKYKRKKIRYSFRWFAYVLGAIGFMFTIFHRVNSAVLAPYIIETFQASGATLGLMSGIYFYVYSLSQPMIGILVDRLKPKKMLTLSVLMISLGTFAFAFAPSIMIIYLGRFLIGAGCAGIFIPVTWIISKYFPFKQSGFLLFMVQFVGNIGSIMAAAPLANLISWLGWKDALIVIGFISIVLGIMIWITVKDSNGSSLQNNAEYTKKKTETDRNWFSIIQELYKMPIIKYCLLSSLTYASMLSFQGLWVVPYLMDVYRIGNINASSMATSIPTGYVIGLLLFSKVSDTKYGKYIYFSANVFITIVYLSLALFLENIPTHLISMMLFIIGISNGASPFLMKIYNLILPKKYFGTALGIVNTIPFLLTAIYQSFSGYLFDVFGGTDLLRRSLLSYRVYYLFLTISLIVGSWAVFKILTILRVKYKDMI
ncbi:MAG: MFS transporter [Candidatus Atribacteria bacterium]|nr:MFS transporter [Candidatus Atribacteria bacterium]